MLRAPGRRVNVTEVQATAARPARHRSRRASPGSALYTTTKWALPSSAHRGGATRVTPRSRGRFALPLLFVTMLANPSGSRSLPAMRAADAAPVAVPPAMSEVCPTTSGRRPGLPPGESFARALVVVHRCRSEGRSSRPGTDASARSAVVSCHGADGMARRGCPAHRAAWRFCCSRSSAQLLA